MVSGVLLLTVSTLAAYYVVAIPTKELTVQHACKGKTLCDVKPDDYPQEMIDHLVKLNLHQLHRWKRQVDISEYNDIIDDDDTNNCARKRQPQTYYSKYNTEGIPEAIVQSDFFTQVITEVSCRSRDKECFGDLLNDDDDSDQREFTCQPFYTRVTLVILTKDRKLKNDTVFIPTDCYCAQV